MIQVRSANRRTLLLPDSPKFLNKKMQKLIISTLRMMNVLLLNWGLMGIFLLMIQGKMYQTLKAMPLLVNLI